MSGGHPRGSAIVAAARSLVGTPFRPQGRGTEGLDCVGLVLAAAGAAGIRVEAPDDYVLGGDHSALAAGSLPAAGCRRLAEALPGDVLLLRAAGGRRHLGIAAGATWVHADLRLHRVVETPAPTVGVEAWRLPEAG